MPMTPEQVRARRQELDERRAEADAELERVHLEYKLLASYCSHPKEYTYSAMGELGTKCPDCGEQT